jgi:retinoic acid-induced protein 1
VAKKENEERDLKKQKGSHSEGHVDPVPGRRPSLIGASKKKIVHNLSQQSDPLTRDMSWICVFCKQSCHHKGLGDLFGPYFVKSEAKPSSPGFSPVSAEGGDKRLSPGSDSESTPGSSKKLKTERKRKGQEVTDSGDKRARTGKGSTCSQELHSPEAQGRSHSSASGSGGASAAEPQQQEVWFHEECIAWSNGVYLVGHRVRNIEEIVKDSSESVCTKCKLTGANLGCLHKGCSSRFHFLCAKDKGCEMEEENFSIYCPKHRRKSKEGEV